MRIDFVTSFVPSAAIAFNPILQDNKEKVKTGEELLNQLFADRRSFFDSWSKSFKKVQIGIYRDKNTGYAIAVAYYNGKDESNKGAGYSIAGAFYYDGSGFDNLTTGDDPKKLGEKIDGSDSRLKSFDSKFIAYVKAKLAGNQSQNGDFDSFEKTLDAKDTVKSSQ